MVDIDDADAFIEGLLMHADSRVYDPVKAREYYLRTRELKGRRKGNATVVTSKARPPAGVEDGNQLSRKQRVNNLLARQAKGLDPAKQAEVTRLSEQAKEDLGKLTQELRGWLDKLQKTTKAANEAAAKEVEQKVAALPPLPRNAGRELKAQRAKKVAAIRASVDSSKQSNNAALNKQIEQKRAEMGVKKDKIVSDLRDAVQAVAGKTGTKVKPTATTATGR